MDGHTDIRAALTVDRTWDDRAAAPGERVAIDATFRWDALEVCIDAPFHGDSPPPAAPGSTPRLWEYEVVELFLLGAGGRYLELEFGPHGHYLVLELHGVRNVVRQGLPLAYSAVVHGDRWVGIASVPATLLPPGLTRWNGYAIHGEGVARRYLCHRPTGGTQPDFHRLASFAPIVPVSDPARGSGTPR